VKVKEAVEQTKIDLVKSIKANLAKHPMSESELADALEVAPKAIRDTMNQMRDRGANFSYVGNRVILHNLIEAGGRVVLNPDRDNGWTSFGITTDNHLCNRHSRLDVLRAAYKHFHSEGIQHVFNCGNWIDGEARFNRQELLVFGMDAQLDYMIQEWPSHPGITTHYISGDDHEGWYSQRECINIGQYLELKAIKSGRHDLHFIGHMESDVALKIGKFEVPMRLMHPGGGSAYALSYAPQKLVESFQGGEKPPVLIIGHYHKYDYCFPREVHVVSSGCTCDQTMFLRKNKIAAHVGYVILRVKQDKSDGHIERVRIEWVPFYDRGFYEKRF
jgi:hypothetical protein